MGCKKNMINLPFHNGIAFIFNVNDWYELRTKYHIIGEYYGVARTTIALPVALCTEELYVLVKKQIARLVKWGKLQNDPSSENRTKFEEKTKQLYEEQKVVYREEKQKQLEIMIDKIIVGKERKGLAELSRDEILQEEINKIPDATEDTMITQIWTQHPDYLRGLYSEIPLSEIYEHTTSLKCAVYEDLWSKGYYITTARKFGGDFLVYLGDPIAFHAVYIVKCVDNNEVQTASEVVALGRLGNSVKKKFVLASLTSSGKVNYLTLTWEDI